MFPYWNMDYRLNSAYQSAVAELVILINKGSAFGKIDFGVELEVHHVALKTNARNLRTFGKVEHKLGGEAVYLDVFLTHLLFQMLSRVPVWLELERCGTLGVDQSG